MDRKEKMGTYVVILFSNHKEVVYEVTDDKVSKDNLEDILASLTDRVITNEDLSIVESGSILYSDQTYTICVIEAISKVEARKIALKLITK